MVVRSVPMSTGDSDSASAVIPAVELERTQSPGRTSVSLPERA